LQLFVLPCVCGWHADQKLQKKMGKRASQPASSLKDLCHVLKQHKIGA
jgi:hypothetical protein